MLPDIRVYRTHIEISPYHQQDCPQLEEMLSIYDNVYHRQIPKAFFVEDDILYVPRGINLSQLQMMFNSVPTVVQGSEDFTKFRGVHMMYGPRDRIQEDAIKFLTSEEQFRKGIYCSQFGLNLDTGDGKTYCTINAIVHFRMRACIIMHKSRLKQQWKEEFLKMTDIKEDQIIDVTGSSMMNSIIAGDIKGYVYILNHQTIESFARQYSWEKVKLFFKKAQIGIKVIDEAHKFFSDILMIDFFSNVERNYYLTATFGRGDPREVAIYMKSFSSLYRFGEETYSYEEKRKHINMVPIYYKSNPPIGTTVQSKYGFSAYKFIDYALHEDNHTLEKVVKRIIDQTDKLEGRILVISPKIESVTYLKEFISTFTDKSVGAVYSSQSKEINDVEIQKDIVCATVKSIGEGDNLKGLRILINLEPIGSKGLADQLRGRLREYSSDKDTFLFYPIDMAFVESYQLFKRILPVMKKKCKQITFMKWMDL